MFYQSTDFKTIFLTTAVAGAHVLVLVLSKDLGSALIFFVTYLLMLFVATGSWVYLDNGKRPWEQELPWQPTSCLTMCAAGWRPGAIRGLI